MKNISDYNSYIKLVDNTCVYENLLRFQNTLNALIIRDRSNLTSFLEVIKQLNVLSKENILDLVGIEFLDDEQKTVAQAKKEVEIQKEISAKTEIYQSIVKNWDSIIVNAKCINQLLVLCLQYKDIISHETLKASHRIQQFMTIQDMGEFKEDFLKRLKVDLSHINIDFSYFSSDFSNVEKNSNNQIIDIVQMQLQAQLEEYKKRLAETEKTRQEEQAKHQQEGLEKIISEDNCIKLELESKTQLEKERIEYEKIKEAKQDGIVKHLSHTPLQTNQNDIVLQCPKCGKEYQSHYTICLKDGTKLVQIHKNFSI